MPKRYTEREGYKVGDTLHLRYSDTVVKYTVERLEEKSMVCKRETFVDDELVDTRTLPGITYTIKKSRFYGTKEEDIS